MEEPLLSSPPISQDPPPLLRRSLSAPSLFPRAGTNPVLRMTELPTHDSFLKLASAGLFAYLAGGVILYATSKESFDGQKTNNPIVDGVYFSMVTLGTIGYGDIVPITKLAKLLTCFFILFGFGYVSVLLNILLARFLDAQEGALVAMADNNRLSSALERSVLDREKKRMRVRTKVGLSVVVVAGCIALGTFVARAIEGLSWVDSFYLAVTSVTTVGYGDVAFKTVGGRIFAVVWVLGSTLAVARAFLYVTVLGVDRHRRRRGQFHRKTMISQDLDHACSSLPLSFVSV